MTSLKYTDRGGRRRGTRVPALKPVSTSCCLSEIQVHLDRDLLSVSLSAFVTSDAGCHSKAIHLIFMHSVCRGRAGQVQCRVLVSWVVCGCLCHPQASSPISPSSMLSPQFPLYCCLFFLFVELIWGRGYANKNMSVFLCWLNSTIAMGNRLLKVVK